MKPVATLDTAPDPTLPWWGWVLYGLVIALFLTVAVGVFFWGSNEGSGTDG